MNNSADMGTSKMGRWLRNVAGIDEEVISVCPGTDKIAATQMGFTLLVNFIIVWFVAFFSVSYIKDLQVTAEGAGGSVVIGATNSSWLYYIAYALVATLIASAIISFDRYIYQQDWFFQKQFRRTYLPLLVFDGAVHGEQAWWVALINGVIGLGNYIISIVAKVFRVSLRLLISLFISLTLGVFMEMWIFGAEISKELQLEYKAANAVSFSRLDDFKSSYDSRINNLKKEADDLKKQPIGGVTLGDVAQGTDALNKESAKLGEMLERIGKRESDEVRAVQPTEESIRRLEEAKAKLAEFRVKLKAAWVRQYYEDTQGIRKYRIICPKKTCDELNSQIAGLDVRINDGARAIEEANRKIAEIRARYNSERETANAGHKVIVAELDSRFKTYAAMREREYADGQAEKIKREGEKQNAIRTLENKAGELENGRKDAIIAKFEEIKASREWVPLADGPVERMRLLWKMRSGEKGDTIFWFGVGVVAFIMFLEILPVLSKIFFLPPTQYALRVQDRVIEYIITDDTLAKLNYEISTVKAQAELERAKADRMHEQRLKELEQKMYSDEGKVA